MQYYRARYYDPRAGRFITQDPIAFAAGVNFYAYVDGNPVTNTDPFGLAVTPSPVPVTPEPPGGGAIEDFVRNYYMMRNANTIGADRYFHCLANCQAASRGPLGKVVAEVISEGREFIDENIKGDTKWQCDDDRVANDMGRTRGCSACEAFRPPWLNPVY